ncbi:MAG: hypothetical protein LC790_22080 [Actinobacteria bacterium]|nr:hypothetical protein [Actinomycetota bacterium]
MFAINDHAIAERYRLLAPHLSEHELRIWAAAEAAVQGPGGTAALARITGLTPAAIRRTQRQLRDQPATDTHGSSG